MSTEPIARELLRLPASERARPTERPSASLHDDAEPDPAWIEEVRRRGQEVDSGAAQALPLCDSLAPVGSGGVTASAPLQGGP